MSVHACPERVTSREAECEIFLHNVHKEFQLEGVSISALNGVTLRINRGEFVAIMGPSGSGKSTLLNIAGCLDRPTSGHFTITGLDTLKMSEKELARIRGRHIGFIFQSFELLHHLTALCNVEIPLIYQDVGPTARRARALRALEGVGLEHRAGHRPTQLSGGEQQRVAIARALVHQPQVILADEPTGNLDRHSGEEVLRLIEGLWGDGLTVVIITHDPGVAARAARKVSLQDGRIVADEDTPVAPRGQDEANRP